MFCFENKVIRNATRVLKISFIHFLKKWLVSIPQNLKNIPFVVFVVDIKGKTKLNYGNYKWQILKVETKMSLNLQMPK